MEKKSSSDERIVKMLITQASGNASKNSKSYRVSIPTLWAKELGVNEDNRDIKISFVDGKIVIEKIETKE